MSDKDYEDWLAKQQAGDSPTYVPKTVTVKDAPPRPDDAELDAKVDHARKKRDDSRWYLVVGVGMLFLGSFHVAVAVGGVFMSVYGAGAYLYWSKRLKDLDDPWDDPEIDAWEEQEFRE